MLEEAERRDHRRIGKAMDLFHFQEEAAGSVFWHPKGWRLWSYAPNPTCAGGWTLPATRRSAPRSSWIAPCGKRPATGKNTASTCSSPSVEDEEKLLALKPMNCPCHVQIFRQGVRSYRELPLRLAEFGSCHRYEPSGALHGLMRVRAFTQDDAHIFCTEAQIAGETAEFVELLRSIYADFGFPEVHIRFSDRPPVRTGDRTRYGTGPRAALREACATAGVDYQLNPGDGAFYGPKLGLPCCATRSGATGSAARCRSISCFPSAWTPNMWARTAPATAR